MSDAAAPRRVQIEALPTELYRAFWHDGLPRNIHVLRESRARGLSPAITQSPAAITPMHAPATRPIKYAILTSRKRIVDEDGHRRMQSAIRLPCQSAC
ncbi:hypothetical protein V4C53_26065 [Paraburkholderia azotifigens]|uniref:hypothetical protein n=1 Tax=Paraburkholderia azotifigens TaxID=2057004 RepID=UPI00316BBA11